MLLLCFFDQTPLHTPIVGESSSKENSKEDFANAVYDDTIDPDIANEFDEFDEFDEKPHTTKSWLIWIVATIALGIGIFIVYAKLIAPGYDNEAVISDVGQVFVTSRPQGATILLDGNDIGEVTPFTIEELAVGEEIIALVMLDGFGSVHQQSTTIEGGVTSELTFNLEPNPVTIHVQTTPPGATVLYDGENVGTTPTTFGPIRKNYQLGIEIMMRLEGYLSQQLHVQWDADAEESRIEHVFEVDPAYVAPIPE